MEWVNKIIQGDCLEVIGEMEDKSVDLCLTDFPYGIEIDYGVYKDTQENLKELIKKLMPELFRVCKKTYLTCGVLNQWLYPQPNWVMGWIVESGGNTGKYGFSCWQPILCYGKDARLGGKQGRARDIIKTTRRTKVEGHPCPKPLDFWKKLLWRVSVSDKDIILDPLMGSGTTCVVAKELGRQFIGIEINEKYCKIAEERIKNTTPPLPFGEKDTGFLLKCCQMSTNCRQLSSAGVILIK